MKENGYMTLVYNNNNNNNNYYYYYKNLHSYILRTAVLLIFKVHVTMDNNSLIIHVPAVKSILIQIYGTENKAIDTHTCSEVRNKLCQL